MDWLLERIRTHGEKAFFAGEKASFSFSDLLNEIVRVRSIFEKSSLRPGGVVALIGDYSLSSIASLLVLAEMKMIVAPIVFQKEEEWKARLNAVYFSAIIDLRDDSIQIREHISNLPVHGIIESLRSKRHSGLILFSSGTTGQPKAMVHDLDVLLGSYQKKRSHTLRILVFLLFDHIGGLNTLLNGLVSGSCLVFPGNRNAENVASFVEKYKVNVLPASPTFLNLLLISGVYKSYDFSSLRIITYGTEPMPESLLKRLKSIFPKVKLIQTFGTSETGISQTQSYSSESTLMKIADISTEYKIVDGELWLRSKTQIVGYLNASMERFTEDDWFRTGDLVEMHGNGFFRIIGRKTDIINVGGEKVFPNEVESVILEMPEVDDCQIYAEPNPITGQTVVAKVVWNDDANLADVKKRVRKWTLQQLDRYKTPTRVILVDSLNSETRIKKSRKTTA